MLSASTTFPSSTPRLSLLISQLTIGYNHRALASQLEAHVESGQLTCLIGSNGAGKSTLLRTLAGLQPPLQGQVLLQDDEQRLTPLHDLSRHQRARLLSVVLTERTEPPLLTVEQTVALGRAPWNGPLRMLTAADHEVIKQSLQQVGMAQAAQRTLPTLSDGERQKVMIARALAQQTPIILLDEPTAFLDHSSKVETMRLLAQLATQTGRTILLSTHDLYLAAKTAHRILSLQEKLRLTTPQQLLEQMEKL